MSNPTSTIILYKASNIIPSRNMVVDSLTDYLSTLTKITINDFQYQRHHLEMEIKIDKTEVWQEFEVSYNYDYVSIQNSDSNKVVYYFILEKRQIANSTIGLKLLMDTANTFKWNVDFTPNAKTRVVREHKDRIAKSSPAQVQLLVENTEATDISVDGSEASIKIIDNDTSEYVDIKGYLDGEISIQSGDEGLITINLDTPELVEFFENISNDLTLSVIVVAPPANFYSILLNEKTYTKYNFIRKIDFYSEGLTPVLYKTELGELRKEDNLGEWSLVYRNTEDDESDPSNIIQCFAVSNMEINVAETSAQTITYTDLVDNTYNIFYATGGNVVTITLNNGKKVNIGEWTINGYTYFVVYRNGTTLKYSVVYSLSATRSGSSWNWNTIGNTLLPYNKSFTNFSFDVEELKYFSTTTNPFTNDTTTGSYLTKSITPTYTALLAYPDLDKTDLKLIKIIKIPYFPTNYEYDENNEAIVVDSNWVYNSSYKALNLNILETRFSATIESIVDNPLNVFSLGVLSPSVNDLRSDLYESKLFHSDFYQPKFVYDSFGFVFQLEKIDEDNFNPSSKFTFEFVMTSTINSKFMFKFPEYILKYSTEDYDNILTIARNNEAPIYNSAYTTYLRTAYRYDLKRLEGETTITALNEGKFQGQNFLAAVGMGMAGDAIGAASAIENAAVSFVNTFINLESKQQSIEQRKLQLKNQANSVRGSDDLDLMENYANNIPKLCLYQVSPRIKSLLADLFYYCGYTTDETKIPTLTTRLWFNYLQCELKVSGIGRNIPEEMMENLKQRYANGITFYHKVSGTWNFAQDLENWEVSAL